MSSAQRIDWLAPCYAAIHLRLLRPLLRRELGRELGRELAPTARLYTPGKDM